MEISSALADHISVFKYIKSENDPLSVYANDLQKVVLLRDRFGELNKFSNWNFNTQLDVFPDKHIEIPFKEICFNEVNHIYDRAVNENKDIYISWSGGVDSSCLLCTFLMSHINKSKLHVILSRNSVNEYPYFYQLLKENGISLIFIEDPAQMLQIYTNIVKNNLIVFGWCGDQLYGSDLNLKYPDWFKKDWKDFIKNLDKKVIDQFEQAFNVYGIPIKNTAQFFWWMNFSAKWTYVSTIFSLMCGCINNIINFYESKDFQNWSMSNFDNVDKHHPTETKFYKPEMKEIIYEFTKDKSYKLYKGKIGSFSVYSKSYSNIISIFDDTGIITYKKSDINIPQIFKKYQKEER